MLDYQKMLKCAKIKSTHAMPRVLNKVRYEVKAMLKGLGFLQRLLMSWAETTGLRSR